MGYAEFKATLKKINLKPKGVKEIVLEISDSALYGKIDMLAEMLDSRVAIAVDSEIVRYSVQINARTEKPTTTYRVDESGIVSEVKPEGEQMELDLGVPKTKEPVKDIPEEIGREVVDEFILSLLAPQYDDLPYPFYAWVARLSEGDTYLKIATEDGMASGKVIDLLDEYRSRVAPLAAKWDEWRTSKSVAPDDSEDEDDVDAEDTEDGSSDHPSSSGDEDIEMEDGDEPESSGSGEDQLSDYEQEIMGGEGPSDNTHSPAEPVDVETIILTEKPTFEDIPYDFPTLLQRKKSGETWMEIANSIGTRSTVLSAAWTKYKKRVEESRGGAA
jgi:hypothetical protein